MLTPNQEKYLLTIPEDKVVKIIPFSPKSREIAEEVIGEVHQVFPELEVLFIGAAALGISGQNDLDINILCPTGDFDKYCPGLTKVFGEPAIKGTSIKWGFVRGEYEIELYLTDPEDPSFQEQLKVFDILKNNQELLKEYEKLKKSFAGKSFKEYQKRKYEFYNRILDQT